MILFTICFILLFKVKNEKIILKEKNLTKEILKIKSAKDYIKYSASRRFQLYLILGFFMVLLTQNLGIDESIAGISWAVLQMIFNGLGILVSFNSDKINRVKFIKFANISSIIVLVSALISRNIIFSFIAIIWIDILSDFYSPMIDAPLTNEIPKEYQLHFGNLKHFLFYLYYLKKVITTGIAKIKICIKALIIKFFIPNLITFSDLIRLPNSQIIKLTKIHTVNNIIRKKKHFPSYYQAFDLSCCLYLNCMVQSFKTSI